MDTLFERFSSPMKNCQFGSTQLQVNHEPTNPLFLPTTPEHPTDSGFLNPGSDGDSFDMSDCNHSVIKYISDILLEEDLEDKPCMLQNCLALQAAEKSFYDVLNPKDPPSPDEPPLPVYQSFEHSDDDSSQSYSSNDSMAAKADSVFDSSETLLVSNSISGNFGGVGEARNLVPNVKHGTIDLERYQLVPPGDNTLRRNFAPEPKNDGYISADRLKGKKNHQREGGDYADGGRSNKQSAALGDDTELQEMFDRVLLCHVNHTHESCIRDKPLSSEGSEKLQPNKQSKGSKTTRLKKQNNYREVVDISTLLTQCAQATASYEQRSASELLKQIRKHSSPYGDATERLAHYFADGLEARLVGARTPSYSPLLSIQIPAAEILKAHQMYVNYCPFKHMLHFFSNRTIIKLAEKATRLHIVDFGISYGFQWPCLIQRLAERNGGPPSIRLTAIELPQPGFRPTERVDETGRRLKKYAARFNVQFEYKVIAQKWETIQLEDLKIDRNELTVVNCMHRLKHIPDETVVVSSPRDLVLKLIRRINPNLFIHGVVNGTYNSPFFVTRFKEALYHFSAMFDMFEATIPREDEQRMMFEKAIYGKDIMNVIACEGLERVERPETYKQWQVRYHRAGFKQVPLDRELLKRVKIMLKAMHYHDHFHIDEDGEWMLQGWKGRIIFGLAFWKPA